MLPNYIKDLPFPLKNCYLVLHKQYYVCSCRKKFYEFLPAGAEAVSIVKFKGLARTDTYQCILVKPKNHSIMDILTDHTQSHLTDYFRKIERSQRLRVKYFVCDMWQPYVNLAHTFSLMQKYALISIILSARTLELWKMSANVCKKP